MVCGALDRARSRIFLRGGRADRATQREMGRGNPLRVLPFGGSATARRRLEPEFPNLLFPARSVPGKEELVELRRCDARP